MLLVAATLARSSFVTRLIDGLFGEVYQLRLNPAIVVVVKRHAAHTSVFVIGLDFGLRFTTFKGLRLLIA